MTTDETKPPVPANPYSYSSSVSAGTPPPRRGWSPVAIILSISGLLFVIFLMVSSVMFFTRGSSEDSRSGGKGLFGKGSVGIIELNGVIMDSKKTLRRIERFEDDGDIKAIVIRLNSPGGAVAPSQEIYQAVKRSKKPVIASMSSVAASGAYYVACGAKKIYANPGTITGSIGVIMEFLNLSKLYDWAKVSRYSIKTGKFKDAGAEYRDMNPEERALLQGMVDDVLTQFKEAVSTGRKLSMEEVTAIADGRIFSGNQAKRAKLVDETGTLQDAIDDAAKMGGIKGKPGIIYPEKPHKGLMELISDQGSDDSEESSVGSASSASPSRSGFGGVVGILDKVVRSAAAPDITASQPGIYWLWTGH